MAFGGGGGAADDITRDGAPLTLYRVHAAIVAELRAIQRRLRVPVIASKHVLFSGAWAADGLAAGRMDAAHVAAGWDVSTLQSSQRNQAPRAPHVAHPCTAPNAPPGCAGGREAAGQPPDPWAHRDSMMKPWQDIVTHRLMLRAEASSGSGGGGGARGAAHAAGAAAEGSPPVRLAKWVLPEDAAVMHFGLDQEGVHLLQVGGPL